MLHFLLHSVHIEEQFLQMIPLTFALEEVEWTEKTSIPTCWGFGTLLSKKLGKLCARKINKASNVTKHQLQENIRILMTELLHKKIWVKDDWWPSSTCTPRRFLMINHHTAHCISEGETKRHLCRYLFAFGMISKRSHNNLLYNLSHNESVHVFSLLWDPY